MKTKKIVSLITGLLFGASLICAAYFSMVLCIALGLAKVAIAEILLIGSFILYPMAVVAIVGAIMVLTKVKVARILLTIAISYFGIFLIGLGVTLFQNASALLSFLLFILILVLGLTSTILSYLIKKQSCVDKENEDVLFVEKDDAV